MDKQSRQGLLNFVLCAGGLGVVLFVLTISIGHALIHPYYVCFPWSNLLYKNTPAHLGLTYPIRWLFHGIALIQFPVYGALYYAGTNRCQRLQILGALLIVHVFVVLLSFVD
jgi:hypothetical protein